MPRITLAVTGMHCDHCVTRVAQALEAVPGVEQVAVFLGDGLAEVDLRAETPPDALIAATAAVGYPSTVA